MLPGRLCKLLQLNNVCSANEKNANCRSIIFLTICKQLGMHHLCHVARRVYWQFSCRISYALKLVPICTKFHTRGYIEGYGEDTSAIFMKSYYIVVQYTHCCPCSILYNSCATFYATPIAANVTLHVVVIGNSLAEYFTMHWNWFRASKPDT